MALAPVLSLAATPEQVETAIHRAVQHLYSQQKNGTWEDLPAPNPNGGESDPNGKQWGGETSIVTYALLAAGESRNDPRIAQAVEFLKRAEMNGIYAVGLRCQAWLLLGADKSLRPYMRRDAEILLTDMYQKGPHAGFFSYYNDHGPQPQDYWDHSVSQYGVLGLWALEQGGIDIPQSVWRSIDIAWRRTQSDEGGWAYRAKDEARKPGEDLVTPQMTAAGLATLFITQDYLQSDSGSCHVNLTIPNLDVALNWMDKHISDALETHDLYCMYGVERIGVASGRKYFGSSSWYDMGADNLVKSQQHDGSWGSLHDTCFGLLFLVRGRAPVAINKLQFENVNLVGKTVEGSWNERPRDAANLSRWISRNLERDLNWQIVSLRASPDDLHDAPILYISASEPLRLSDSDTDKLRRFVQQGGMIVANANCSKKAFSDSIVALAKTMFPDYAFRELEERHPIYTLEQFPASNWKTRPSVLGLSNGVRELMLLVPDADLSRAWQMHADKGHEVPYQLGADIFVYAIDKADRKNLRVKGDTGIVKLDPAIRPEKTIKIARLEIGQNWDPEPGGWVRMNAIMHNTYKTALQVQPIKLPEQKLTGITIAHLTGTTKFTLTGPQRSALQQFVSQGGTLVVDAAGGSKAFADAAQAELEATFGPAAASLSKPLPPFSPVYTIPGATMEAVSYRTFIRKSLGGDVHSPRVRGIEQNGRIAVFFSREDISGGLVGEPVDGVAGYSPETATQLMRNIILYSSKK